MNESIFPQTRECLFRSLREGRSALVERISGLEKASEHLWSKVSFSKAKFFYVFFQVNYSPLIPKHGHWLYSTLLHNLILFLGIICQAVAFFSMGNLKSL